jgi:hypothetical protein
MDLAELRAGVADVPVTYKGQQFTVGYRPESVGEDDLEMLEKFQDKSGVTLLRATVEPLARLLVRWSLTDGTTPIVVSEDALKTVPPRMRVAILQSIMADFFDAGNAETSDAGSPETAASEAAVPTTPSLSSTPNGQVSPHGISQDSLTLAAG